MLNDNTRSLIEYVLDDERYNDYELILFSKKNPISSTRIKWIENKYLGLLALYRSKYIFHSQGMGRAQFKSWYGQSVINIWHGTPLKSIGLNIKSNSKKNIENYDDYCLVSSNYFKEIYMESFGYKAKQLVVAGNPRNDYLYKYINLYEKFGISASYKIILFMPTFRNSNNNQFRDSNISFPILKEENIDILNSKLVELEQYLVIKPHPYQMNELIFNKEYTNILILTDEKLDELEIRLYTLLGNCDLLITDYSSVFFDFLLMNKPIAFTIPDIEEYKKKRGFSIEKPEELMPGTKIKTFEDFVLFLEDFNENIDFFKNDRIQINLLVNEYRGYENSKEILNIFIKEKENK